MKRVTFLIVFALLGLLAAAPAVQAAPPTTGFTGHWEAIDPADGSNLDVFIFGGKNVQMLYTDDEATFACEGLDDQSWSSFLTGKVDGDTLVSTMHWAKCGLMPSGSGFVITWTLEGDVLTNDFNEVYTRVP
ncbi:MAG TPA: hypothetical protein VFP83_01540 [Candidatus Limnocylindria bacterium]|nr:hypothetical protein [Candidatus Limnocylindria bacterium]